LAFFIKNGIKNNQNLTTNPLKS